MRLKRATLVGMTAIFWWSLSPLFISYTTGVPPFLTAGLVLGFGFLFFSLRWLLTRAPILAYIRQPVRVWIQGFWGLTLYMILFTAGLKLAPVAEATLCNYLWPTVMVVVAALLENRSLRWNQACGIGLSFLGLFVLIGAPLGGGFLFHLRLGHVLALAGAIVWGTYSALGKRFSSIDSNVMGVYFGMGSAVLLLISVAIETRPTFGSDRLWPVIACGFSSHAGYYAWDIGMKKGETAPLGAASFLTPAVATLWLFVCGRAASTGSLWLPILLMLVGTGLAGLDRLL